MTEPLDNEDKELFLKAKINGKAFLGVAGDREFFRSAGLAPGVSQNLAELAKETIGRKSECCFYIIRVTQTSASTSCTPRGRPLS